MNFVEYKGPSHFPSIQEDVVLDKQLDPQPQEELAKYEYNIKIACHLTACRPAVVGEFNLAKSELEPAITSWVKKGKDGHTILTADVFHQEPKRLYHSFEGRVNSALGGVNSALGSENVEVLSKNSGVINESFIPVRLAVQLGKRLGVPTLGYYYHFIDGKLVHEYALAGEGNSQFRVTLSTASLLNQTAKTNRPLTYLLLPWHRHGQEVSTQHLLYQLSPIDSEVLAFIDVSWLDEHAFKVDLQQIIDTLSKEKAKREYEQNGDTYYNLLAGDTLWDVAQKYGVAVNDLIELNPAVKGREKSLQIGETLLIYPKKNIEHQTRLHIVVSAQNDEGRELWKDIAEQHQLTPLELLRLNPSYEPDPSVLKVGDALRVSRTPATNTTTSERNTLPPVAITAVTKAEDASYQRPNLRLTEHVNAISAAKDMIPLLNIATIADYKEPAESLKDDSKPVPYETTLDPRLMYWPDYNFLTGEKVNAKMRVNYDDTVAESIAVMSAEEAGEFLHDILVKMGISVEEFIKSRFSDENRRDTLTHFNNLRDFISTRVNAQAIARELGSLNVISKVTTYNGRAYIVIKGYKNHLKTLVAGNRWRASNPQVTDLGLGLAGGHGKMAYFKTTVKLTILFTAGINVIEHILKDESTMVDLLGRTASDLTQAFVATAIGIKFGSTVAAVYVGLKGLIFGAGAVAAAPYVLVISTVAVVTIGTSVLFNSIDDHYKLTDSMIDAVKDVIDEN
ncbi:LysM peptidoglycan-binding domain-containing protein [Thaumasiovibrio sp. DFM-14]|uniref:MIX and LysM peptidoglycan-binding domain-containing protein n=1 Tax=Thaumasiovibrio sp. DFM-14 TaxID=3384792 RepID=UPI0039A00D9D